MSDWQPIGTNATVCFSAVDECAALKPHEAVFLRAVVGFYPGDLVGSHIRITRKMLPEELGEIFRALTTSLKEKK